MADGYSTESLNTPCSNTVGRLTRRPTTPRKTLMCFPWQSNPHQLLWAMVLAFGVFAGCSATAPLVHPDHNWLGTCGSHCAGRPPGSVHPVFHAGPWPAPPRAKFHPVPTAPVFQPSAAAATGFTGSDTSPNLPCFPASPKSPLEPELLPTPSTSLPRIDVPPPTAAVVPSNGERRSNQAKSNQAKATVTFVD